MINRFFLINIKWRNGEKNSFSAKKMKRVLKPIKERERDITQKQHKFKYWGNVVVPFSKC